MARSANWQGHTDNRVLFKHHRIEHEGNVWHIDARYNPDTKTLIVYRVYGDVTSESLTDALESFTNEIGSSLTV